jgi:hypothetical protein
MIYRTKIWLFNEMFKIWVKLEPFNGLHCDFVIRPIVFILRMTVSKTIAHLNELTEETTDDCIRISLRWSDFGL